MPKKEPTYVDFDEHFRLYISPNSSTKHRPIKYSSYRFYLVRVSNSIRNKCAQMTGIIAGISQKHNFFFIEYGIHEKAEDVIIEQELRRTATEFRCPNAISV